MKIAIVQGKDVDSYDGYESVIALRCTEFAEVDEETYNYLVKNSYRLKYTVIRSVENLPMFIKTSVKDYLEYIKGLEEQARKNKEEREKKKEENRKKKDSRQAAERVALYEKLKIEMGDK